VKLTTPVLLVLKVGIRGAVRLYALMLIKHRDNFNFNLTVVVTKKWYETLKFKYTEKCMMVYPA